MCKFGKFICDVMGCRQSQNIENVELTPQKFTTKIDPRVLQKYDIQGK